jgi:4,5-dihydroxyphthalate decarboxylase
VYARAVLEHEFDLALRDVSWIQAGTNEPGRKEGVGITLPSGVSLTAMPEDTLNDLLLAGEIDAVIAAHPPTEFVRGTGRIVRLFSDFRAVEEASYRRSGVFPIMHVLTLRAELYERHRWIAMNLMTAFEEAKRRSISRVLDVNAPRLPVPWGPANVQRAQALIGDDPWPYGIEKNYVTLDAFLGYAFEQGVSARRLAVEELFVAEVQEGFTV